MNYPRAFQLQYCVSLAEAGISIIVGDVMPLRYLPKQSRLPHSLHVRFVHLITKNFDASPTLESLNESQDNGKEVLISHLDGEVLHANEASFVVLMIKAFETQIINHTKSAVFHAPSFYRFGEQLLKKLYDLFEEFHDSLKPCFPGFTTEMLAKFPDEGMLIKQLSLKTCDCLSRTQEIRRTDGRRTQQLEGRSCCHVSGNKLNKMGSSTPAFAVLLRFTHIV